MTSAIADDGRLSQYEDDDFLLNGQTMARINVTTRDRSGQGDAVTRVMGECCDQGDQVQISVDIVIPTRDAGEAALDIVEAEFWPRFAVVNLPTPLEHDAIQYLGVGTSFGPLDAECPVVARTLLFALDYGFNPKKPAQAIKPG